MLSLRFSSSRFLINTYIHYKYCKSLEIIKEKTYIICIVCRFLNVELNNWSWRPKTPMCRNSLGFCLAMGLTLHQPFFPSLPYRMADRGRMQIYLKQSAFCCSSTGSGKTCSRSGKTMCLVKRREIIIIIVGNKGQRIYIYISIYVFNLFMCVFVDATFTIFYTFCIICGV